MDADAGENLAQARTGIWLMPRVSRELPTADSLGDRRVIGDKRLLDCLALTKTCKPCKNLKNSNRRATLLCHPVCLRQRWLGAMPCVTRLKLPMYAIVYTQSDLQPRQNGVLWDWSVNRSASIGNLFARIKDKRISFPRLEDCGSFVDEFACEVVVHDDHNRTIKYTHPESQPDDALHSTNYALLMGVRLHAHIQSTR